MGFKKEYHVFDALHLKTCKVFMRQQIENLEKVLSEGKLLSTHKNILRHIDFYRDTQNYYNFFDHLQQANNIELVGDITPSYAGIPSFAYNEIKQNLEQRGFEIKVIFLMRDPIERIWSQVRMSRRNKLRQNPSHILKYGEIEELSSIYKLNNTSSDHSTIKPSKNIEAVFSPNQIYYGFFEELFTTKTVKEICSFLEIDYQEPKIERSVNVSPKGNTKIDPKLISEIVEHYKNTYGYCIDRFGESFIKLIWRSCIYRK